MTKKAMETVAADFDAEVVRLKDDVERRGWVGWLRCGLDAMRRDTHPLLHFETEQPLESYRMVIVGTPVWAGRCSAVTRAFLKEHGKKLNKVSYVVTRGSDGRFEEIYRQMDLYVPNGHLAAVSLRPNSVGYDFWMEDFIRQVRAKLSAK
jgi:hypothetical protein